MVEYTITVANSSTTTAADGLAISDPIPATTTFQTGLYAGPSDVAITGGAAATCIAETPADTNADGCFRNGGGNLVVGGAALGSIAAGGVGDRAVPRPDQLIASIARWVRPQRRGHANYAAPRRPGQRSLLLGRAEQRKAAPPAPFVHARLSQRALLVRCCSPRRPPRRRPERSISNRAEVQFIGSAGPTTIVSNSVDVVVVPAPSRAALTLLRAD